MADEDTLPIDDDLLDEDDELEDDEDDELEGEDDELEGEEEASIEVMADAELADAAHDPDEDDEVTTTFLPADGPIDLDDFDEIEKATTPAGDTFVCSDCFLSKPRIQLVDEDRMLCVDCID